jgi:hypothetical protein
VKWIIKRKHKKNGKDDFQAMLVFDVPPSSLLDPKKSPTMLKSESSWNLVPLPTSSTKGGERGMLKAPGLE